MSGSEKMNGIINVYKELGMTSHDVVAKIRKILWTKKVGHTGTLDPEAEGVLPICVGKATKLAATITEGVKGYETTLRFGKTTTTGDHTGETIETFEFDYDEEAVTEAVNSFVGKIQQVPPMYSALKVNGKKLYELAREGKVVERQPREIEIKSLEILEFLPPDALRLRVICSKGTYIRTLCEDIGAKLGYGGHMDGLVRISSGHFKIQDSVKLAQIQTLKDEDRLDEVFITIEKLLEEHAPIQVRPALDKALDNGNMIWVKDLGVEVKEMREGAYYRMYTSDNRFIGLYEAKVRQGALCLKAHKILAN